MALDKSVDLEEIIELTEGISGADLKAICTEAGMFAIREERDHITHDDFLDAVDKIMAKEAESDFETQAGVMFG